MLDASMSESSGFFKSQFMPASIAACVSLLYAEVAGIIDIHIEETKTIVMSIAIALFFRICIFFFSNFGPGKLVF